jgi:hypothetical protein
MEWRRRYDVFLIPLSAALALASGAIYIYINLYFTDGKLTLPLDDAYIFLHYARNFAAGHPLVYNVGDAATTGVTSYLYLLLLTPLALIFRGADSLVWAAFILNVVIYGFSIWLFARIARHLFEGRYVFPSTCIFATTGPITFHALGGMDAGLYVGALLFALFAYIHYREYGRLAMFIVALAVLTLARPEGIGAAAILAVISLIGREPNNSNNNSGKAPAPLPRRRWLVLLGLAPVPLYFLVNYLVGGHLGSASFLSKSILNHGGQPWAMRIAAILGFTIYVVKSILAGLDGLYLRAFLNANTPYAGANFFAPLALAFFLVGWGRAARKSWQNRMPSAGFAAGVVFLAGVAAACIALPFPRHFARYIAPYFPFFVIGIMGGIDGLAQLIRYGRPSISHDAMFWTGASYFLVFGLLSSAYFCVAFGMSGRDIRFQHIAVASHIRENVPPRASIFTHDVGALAYYGEHRVVDLEGLVTRDGWSYGNLGLGGSAEFVRERGRVGDYFVGYFDVYEFDESRAVEPPEYTGRLFATTMAGGQVMSVARFVPEVFETPPPPGAAQLEGFVREDGVDVANFASEEAHGYRLRRRAANTLSAFCELKPLWGRGEKVFEAGRTVCGVEEFTVKVPAGRDVVAVVRCDPPYRAEVHVNGASAGTWEVAPVSADAYVDGFFAISRRHVPDGALRIKLETLGDDLSYNKPVRYDFYSRAQ